MSKQPEALSLADAIDSSSSSFYAESSMSYDHELAMTVGAAADELRRLHAVNVALLEALKAVVEWLEQGDHESEMHSSARAAITKAEAA
jgi:hypothetical protein